VTLRNVFARYIPDEAAFFYSSKPSPFSMNVFDDRNFCILAMDSEKFSLEPRPSRTSEMRGWLWFFDED